MDTGVIIAIITGIASVLGVVLTNSKSNRDMDAKLDKAQAITETKLDALTAEVKRHNDFAAKIPQIQGDIKVINEKLSVENHRITDIERKLGQ